jgi:hypothetical protein
MLPNVTAMKSARTLGSLGASLLLTGCAASAPQGPSILTFPGKDKSAAAFQQDQAICRRHAISHTGYGLASEPAGQPSDAGAATTTGGGAAPPSPGPGATTDKVPAAAKAEIPDQLSYAQCMAARGDRVLSVTPYDEQYTYAYPDGFGYGGAYPYAYPLYGAGLVGGFGFFGFGHGHHHHGYHHGGGGYHGGGYHGGGHHGGWGGHGGGGHGGGGHH